MILSWTPGLLIHYIKAYNLIEKYTTHIKDILSQCRSYIVGAWLKHILL